MKRGTRCGGVALSCIALLACGHTPESKRGQILGRVYAMNTPNEQAVLSRFLRAEHVTLLHPERQALEDPALSKHSNVRVQPGGNISFRDKRGRQIHLDLDWRFFDALMQQEGRVEARTASGERVLLLDAPESEEEGPWNHHYYARTKEGKLFSLRTVLRPVRRHRITVPGNCDRMPMLEPPPPRVFLIFEGFRASDVETKEVILPYEGEDITYGCESYTY